MTRNGPDLANILETCLARMDAGSTIDELVNEYAAHSSEKAEELRALLHTALAILPEKESQRVPTAAQRNSRQRFLSQAQKLQQQPGAASLQRWLRFLRFLQRHAGSVAFAVGAIILLFLAFGSTRALPGDRLYPVKLAAEQASNSLPGSAAAQEASETVYDNRRAEEVAAMIQMKRTGTVSFGGYLSRTKDKVWQAAGIILKIPQAKDQQAQALNGVYVEIKGFLESNGEVQVESLDPRLETLQGTIARIEPGRWTVGSQQVIITEYTQITGTPRIGSMVLIQTANLENSTQIQAITAAVRSETITASPVGTTTPTTLPTFTEAPTETPQPTIKAKPNLIQTPQGKDKEQTQPGESDDESEEDHDGDSPESNRSSKPPGDH